MNMNLIFINKFNFIIDEKLVQPGWMNLQGVLSRSDWRVIGMPFNCKPGIDDTFF